jgi:hypothetical protein
MRSSAGAPLACARSQAIAAARERPRGTRTPVSSRMGGSSRAGDWRAAGIRRGCRISRRRWRELQREPQREDDATRIHRCGREVDVGASDDVASRLGVSTTTGRGPGLVRQPQARAAARVALPALHLVETSSSGTRHRLPFLNRTLFAGVPIPPLEVTLGACEASAAVNGQCGDPTAVRTNGDEIGDPKSSDLASVSPPT